MTDEELYPFVDVLINQAKKELGEDLDLVLRCGSRTKDYAESESDYDVYYVPAQGKGIWNNWTWSIRGILIDLFPVQWEGIEARAGFEAGHTGTLVESKILYARNEEVRKRFESLQEAARGLLKPDHGREMLEKAMKRFKEAAYHLVTLEHVCDPEDERSWRKEAFEVCENTVMSLAIVNQVLTRKWWVRSIDELGALSKRPADLEQSLKTISLSPSYDEVRKTAAGLVCSVRALLVEEQRRLMKRTHAWKVWLPYAEWHEMYRKAIRAGKKGNLCEVNATISFYISETALARAGLRESVDYSGFNILAEYGKEYDKAGFPNVPFCKSAEDLVFIAKSLEAHDQRLRALLKSEGLSLFEAESVEQLERLLEKNG